MRLNSLYGKSLIVLVLCTVVSGCSKKKVEGRPDLFPATGVVLQDKTPVAGATVVFMPTSHQYASAGMTDDQGRFQLRTFEPNDGAPAGGYQVTVRKFYFVGDVEHQSLPVRYSNPKGSGLTAEIRADGKNEFVFELTK